MAPQDLDAPVAITNGPMAERSRLLELWRFPWPIMDVLIAGKSSIDLPELRVSDWEQATQFLRAYGYDPDDREERKTLHAVIVEAVAFIEDQLLSHREWARGVRPPDDILYCTDARHLLLFASSTSPEERLKRSWACAVLRVMHTIAHIEGTTRTASVAIAREQIMARFNQFLFRDEQKRLWLGQGDDRVELDRIEWKQHKTRRSIILKLLHKRDNVAETIYDYLGVRFVTKRLVDVMLTVRMLHRFHMVTYPNCYPARARNNLVDLTRFKSQIDALRDMLMAGTLPPEEFDDMLTRLRASENPEPSANPHSLSDYRSIQLTGRQMIKVRGERFEWLDKILKDIDTKILPDPTARALRELRYLVDGWHSVVDAREHSSFFPFEIQIMDTESYGEAMSGEAAHARYKRSQVRAARKRVLHKVLELAKQEELKASS